MQYNRKQQDPQKAKRETSIWPPTQLNLRLDEWAKETGNAQAAENIKRLCTGTLPPEVNSKTVQIKRKAFIAWAGSKLE